MVEGVFYYHRKTNCLMNCSYLRSVSRYVINSISDFSENSLFSDTLNHIIMNKIILYYKYTNIEDLPKFCDKHRKKCLDLNLLGRIYLAQEGINGTLSGLPENIEVYKKYLLALDGFDGTSFKESTCEKVPFRKMIVRIRSELAALKSSMKLDLNKNSANHLSPKEWKTTIESNVDYVMIDVRNDYEYAIGHFDRGMKMNVKNFFDSENWLEKENIPKDKKILMYCTGGIRCEKFSLLMKSKGYEDVNQLDGGIINYAQTVGGDHYKGRCFVFDDRLSIPIEKNQKNPLTRCLITDVPCDQYLNCADPDCNKLFICSIEGAKKMKGCCSEECMKSDRLRPLNPDNIYEPSKKWYEYFDSKQ